MWGVENIPSIKKQTSQVKQTDIIFNDKYLVFLLNIKVQGKLKHNLKAYVRVAKENYT